MSRGKYGAKAVKRQETQALEAEVANLRHALGRITKERDEASETLGKLRIAAAAERRALIADAEAGASPRLRRLQDELQAERQARADEHWRFACEAFDVLGEYAARIPNGGLEAMAAVFGQSHRLGELVDSEGVGPRRARRATARTSRLIRDMKGAPEWAQAPAKAAGK